MRSQDRLFFAGFLIGLGSVIRLSAIIENKDFSIKISEPESLCTSGIYSSVRHPSYLGTVLILSGFSLGAFGLQSAFITALLCFLFLNKRAEKEDKILEAKFLESFDDYKNKTNKFIPKI